MIDDDFLGAAGGLLSVRAEAVRTAQFRAAVSRRFSFDTLHAGLARGEIQNWLDGEDGVDPRGRGIYKISATSLPGVQALSGAFAAIRGRVAYKLARRNHTHSGLVLYVGSSRKVASRLREHLRHPSAATYALHLHRWCPPGDHQLLVEVQAPAADLSDGTVQDVEDALWDRHQPLFGRRGAR